MSNGLYGVHGSTRYLFFFDHSNFMGIVTAMVRGEPWPGHARLLAACEADGRSLDAISMAAGQKRGYLRSILRGGRNKKVITPTHPRLKAIYRALGLPIESADDADGIATQVENLSAGGKATIKAMIAHLLSVEGKRR